MSQFNVAKTFRCGGHLIILYYKFTAESVWTEFLKSLNIWQSYGKKLIASSAINSSALCDWVL